MKNIELSKRGYLVTINQNESGGFRDRVVLVYYESMPFHSGEIDKVINEYLITNRDYLLEYVKNTGFKGDRDFHILFGRT